MAHLWAWPWGIKCLAEYHEMINDDDDDDDDETVATKSTSYRGLIEFKFKTPVFTARCTIVRSAV